jgi:Ca2+-binding RTX toxin-like protein
MHHQFLRAKPLTVAASLGIGVVLMSAAAAASAATSTEPSAVVSNGALVIGGTDRSDSITVSTDPATNAIVVALGDGSAPERFDSTTLTAISATLGAGNDQFTVSPNAPTPATLPVSVDGNHGNDVITTGAAADTISGGAGDDIINAGAGDDSIIGNGGADIVHGQRGNDTEDLGSGDDISTWIPGDGSDTVNGDAGRDTLDFVGANVAESTSLSADGTHAIFSRDIASIRMDLNNVERITFEALGGADRIAVGDLSGTDLRQVNLDLAAAPGNGVGDQLADAVAVEGTDKGDHISVDAVAGAVHVSGLAADVDIAGADNADHLQVNADGGNDTVGVSDAASALLPTSVDLGTGQR